MKKEYDFSRGTRGRFYSPKKISTTIRLDDDVLLYLKKLASIKKVRYQTLLNSILRDYVQKVAQ
jgi:predicted DNA binding CopG/RHH family protein